MSSEIEANERLTASLDKVLGAILSQSEFNFVKKFIQSSSDMNELLVVKKKVDKRIVRVIEWHKEKTLKIKMKTGSPSPVAPNDEDSDEMSEEDEDDESFGKNIKKLKKSGARASATVSFSFDGHKSKSKANTSKYSLKGLLGKRK